ncbi:MAG: hypothetical protein AAF337_15305 [Pseudomonadota bacterium]
MSVPPLLNTASGRTIDLARPERSDFLVSDIATGLSRAARFGGQTTQPWWVIQHSLCAYDLAKSFGLSPDLQMQALLHDAEEAYLTDIPAPAKEPEDVVCHYQEGLRGAIMAWAGVPYGLDLDPAVKRIDMILLHVEASLLQKNNAALRWPVPFEALEHLAPRRDFIEAARAVVDRLIPKRGMGAYFVFEKLFEKLLEEWRADHPPVVQAPR